jgi:hypothetical protein
VTIVEYCVFKEERDDEVDRRVKEIVVLGPTL